MASASHVYQVTAWVYIDVVRHTSPEAACAIETILARFGAQAALRAALVVTMVKMEIEQNRWVPYIGLYVHLLADYPEALSLALDAITCCIETLAPTVAELGDRQYWAPV